MWYEYEPSKKTLIKQKHWWVQAETIVGFYNAYQYTDDEKYLQPSLKNWRFIQQHWLDDRTGGSFWGINEDYSIMQNEDKAGLWKCPYHNSRACL